MTTMRELAKLGAVTYSDGYRTKRGEHGRPGFRILRVADVADGAVLVAGDDFVASTYRPKIGAKLSQTGDVLLTTKGTVGRVAIMPPVDEPVVYSPQLCFFRVGDTSRIEPRWLSYWFKSEGFQRQALHRANNTDMAAYINLADIGSLQLPETPVDQQRAIAEVLGALDDKIAANSKVSRCAHMLAEHLYAAGTATAERRALLEVLEPLSGGTPSRNTPEYWGGDVPWVSAKDIASAVSGVVVQTDEHITAEATGRTRVKPVPRGSVILTARGTVGRVARLGLDAAFNQSCFGFSPGALPAGLLYFAIRDVAEQTSSLTHGSVFDTITLATFRHVSVPVLSEADPLEESLTSLLDRVQCAAQESRVLSATRDALLPLLMSGKVRVRDAEKVVEGVL